MASLLHALWTKRPPSITNEASVLGSNTMLESRTSWHEENQQEICVKPITRFGKGLQLLRLVSVTLLPISILLALVGSIFVVRLDDFLKVQDIAQSLRFSLEVSELVDKLQKERDLSVIYSSSLGVATKTQLVERYPITDAAIQSLTDWDASDDNHLDCFQSKEKFQNYLNRHRYELDAHRQTEKDELRFYSEIIEIFIKWFYDAMTVTSSGTVWKLLVALQETMEAKEKFGIERAFGSMYFIQGGFQSREDYLIFAESQDVANASLNSARQFSADVEGVYQESVSDEQQRLFEVVIRRFQFEIRLNPFPKDLPPCVKKAKYWSDNMTLYVDATLSFQNKLTHRIYDDLIATQHTQMVILTVLGFVVFFVVIMCPVILKAIFSLASQIHTYSYQLWKRTETIRLMKIRTEFKRYRLLPQPVAQKYKEGENLCTELFADVTIMIAELDDFTLLSAKSSPEQVISILDSLYSCLDQCIAMCDVYKANSASGAYMLASGLKHVTRERSSSDLGLIALNMVHRVKAITIPHMPGTKLRMRIGIHSGPVVAGVVATAMPQYCLVGETVNIAAIMQQTARGGRIQVSEAAVRNLGDGDDFVFLPRVPSLGALQGMCSFWLTSSSNAQLNDDSLDELDTSDSEEGSADDDDEDSVV